MTASYRVVHFTPDPFVEARFPLGAVVQDAEGRVQVVQAKRLPSADCLGDAQLAYLAERLRGHLDSITSIDALPPIFGPYTELGRRYELPVEVRDPVLWVRGLFQPMLSTPDTLLAQVGAHLSEPAWPAAFDTAQQALQRRAAKVALEAVAPTPRTPIALRVFADRPAARYIRRNFKPAQDWGGWLGQQAQYLNEVSYWVQGVDEVLLMEPVVPGKRTFERDLKDITTKFLAYRGLMEQRVDDPRHGTLMAFITPHASAHQRKHAASAVRALTGVADEIVDTSELAQLEDLLGRIEHLGAVEAGRARLSLDSVNK